MLMSSMTSTTPAVMWCHIRGNKLNQTPDGHTCCCCESMSSMTLSRCWRPPRRCPRWPLQSTSYSVDTGVLLLMSMSSMTSSWCRCPWCHPDVCIHGLLDFHAVQFHIVWGLSGSFQMWWWFPRSLGNDEKTEARSALNMMVIFPSDYGSTTAVRLWFISGWGSNPATG